MNLCIDVGNTQVKLGAYNVSGQLEHYERIANLNEKDLEKILKQWGIEYAILSSVRAEHEGVVDYLKQHLKKVLKLSSELPLPITNEYQTPRTLGNDRLAGVIGASTLYPNENLLVVDAGTCITYDFITKDNIYFGGSILPGIEMRFKALNHFTAKLPLVEKVELNSFIGNTTQTSIQTGVLFGVLHELKGFKQQYQAKFGNIKVIVTGGDTSFFESQLKNEIFAQPNLVLIGLNKILEYNINLKI